MQKKCNEVAAWERAKAAAKKRQEQEQEAA